MDRPSPEARAAARALARLDPAWREPLRQLEPYPGFPTPALARRSHFEQLARAIVFQQLAGSAARAIFERVRALGAKGRFPSPERLLQIPEERLRGAGLSRNKLRSLQDLAERALDGRLRLRSLGRLPDEEVVEHLVQVRGIGPWTAQMHLIFKLGRPDVFAPKDLGLQEGIRLLDGLADRPGPSEASARAEAWRPWRSAACWYLWRLTELRTPGS